ncbi:hypothetical protein ITI46_01040 [Streptomyces oryzae]|uniref:DUF4232 domain-containing protein n=1 Tax=Streptomyces oryzae TaxID=1434886 RepID=A0ABS3X4N7_9ACTN|nr:hypothetical protein [Streptomyces oryzae]MBO8190308.1 hypothetical protein [Streptomyces oryzae]
MIFGNSTGRCQAPTPEAPIPWGTASDTHGGPHESHWQRRPCRPARGCRCRRCGFAGGLPARRRHGPRRRILVLRRGVEGLRGNESGPADSDSGSTGNGGAQGNKESGNGADKPTGGGTSGAKGAACTVGKVPVSLQETGGSAPVIPLKATNSGSTHCDQYGYPDAQFPIPVGGGKVTAPSRVDLTLIDNSTATCWNDTTEQVLQ